MKKFNLLILSVLLFGVSYYSYGQRICAAHDHMIEQMNHNPKMYQKILDLEEFTQRYIKNYGTSHKSTVTRTIPVHVIVVYSSSVQNISEAQIQSQIDVLNYDYGGYNSDLTTVPSEFTSVTCSGTGIQFILSSIERHSNSTTSWGYQDAVKSAYPPTDPTTTLNLWVCNIGSGILGYSQFPGGDLETDGVVISPQYFGSSDYDDGSFYLSSPFDKGRTATHEVGHYLNLRHIWGDGNCSVDDYVEDTPIAGAANYDCPTYPSKSCTSNGGWTSDMFMNYMDYVDDACMFMFSDGQSARMWACLTSSRAELGYSDGNVAPTVVINGPYTGDANTAIAFSSSGSTDADGSIVSYLWSFGDGNTSTEANPSYAYASDGLYTVTLTVTDDGDKSSTAATTATIGNVCSGIQACDGNIQLDLTTDRYASETSWTLTNSAGTTVESGSGYSNSTSYTINFSLNEDTYTFTIKDSYGDGICCTYGSGSYALTDGCGTVIQTGGSFTSSESVTFCVPSGSTSSNIAPVAQINGPYAGEAGQAISFSSSGSTDTDGSIASYLWEFGDGSSSTSANPTYTYSTAGSYIVSLTVTDNAGSSTTASTTATISAAGSTTTVELTFDDFESGWGNWTDGGEDCSRYNSSTYAYSGSYSIDLQDNSSTASSTYLTNGIDVSLYTSIEVEFYFYAYGMETGEDFWVQYYDGSAWNTVAVYSSGTSFDNNTFYVATVTISNSDYTFPTNMKIGFMCDASSNSDDIFIDDITISATSGTARKYSSNSLTAISYLRNDIAIDLMNDEVFIYPNPAKSVLNIELSVEDQSTVFIYDLTGNLIKAEILSTDKNEIDISDFKEGLYLLRINNGNESYHFKFLKD